MKTNGQANGNGGRGGNGSGRALPKRFYQAASAVQAEDGRWAVALDGRRAKTPGKRDLMVATLAFGTAIAEEWQAQVGVIDPAKMPLTRLANTAIDGVAGREASVVADIVKYAGSDLLCYRADGPERLVRLQSALWDGVLAWARERHGVSFSVQTGLMPVPQPAELGRGISVALAGHDAFGLAALHVMTTLMGSAVLAMAVAGRHLTAEEAWHAAHVDEDWQIEQWGEDAEAAARRQRRWGEMAAAARLLALLETGGH